MAEKRLYIRIRGRVIGPFSLQQLVALRDRGQFKRFHEVSADRQGWQPASVITEVFAEDGQDREELDFGPAVKETSPGAVNVELVPAVSAAEWYYANSDGQQAGPVPREQLQGMWASGAVNASTLVWKEGMPNWLAITAPELGLVAGVRTSGGKTPASGGTGAGAGMAAVKGFFADPAGGLLPLCEALGNAGAFWLGIVFVVVIDLCLVLGSFLANWDLDKIPGLVMALDRTPAGTFSLPAGATTAAKLATVMKFAAIAFFPLFALAATIAVVRAIAGGRARLGFDVLLASAVLLPMGLLVPIAVLMGNAPPEAKTFLYVLFVILPVLILNGGLTRVVGISDRGAILAVPVVVGINLWLWKVVWTSVILN
jgi:hypothetical protein